MHGMIRWVAVVMVVVSAGAFAHAAGDPEEDMPTGTTPTTKPASAGRSPTTRPTVSPPAKDVFHIYLLMGQSNMDGRDKRSLDAQVDNPRVLALSDDGRWTIARDPLRSSSPKGGIGPGVPFAIEMAKADPKVTIGLVPCAVGGTPLNRWVKGGDLYRASVARAKVAAQSGVIKGVLWHQGESDASIQKTADSYEKRLAQMFADLRKDLGNPDLPIVVGQLGDFLRPEKIPHAETVRAALKRMPEVSPNVGYAETAGLNHIGDRLHFDADGAKTLGKHFAEAMRELQNQK